MEWLSNLGTSDVLLIIIIMYLHGIRGDISKLQDKEWVSKLDRLLQANSVGVHVGFKDVQAELRAIRNKLK